MSSEALAPAGRVAEGRDDKRRAIAEAAGRMFDEHGYANTSLAMVARAAGVAKATVYHYFISKEDILFALHEDLMSLLEQRMAAREASGASAAEVLAGVASDIIDNMDKRRGHVRVFVENFRLLSGENKERAAARRDAYAGAVERTIETAITDGQFRNVPPRMAALALFGMVNWAYQWYRSENERSAEDVAAALWDLYYGGVGRADNA